MNNLEQSLQQWMTRNNKDMTYGELMELSRGEKNNMSDNFYSESEKKLRDEIIKSDRERLLRLG